MCVCVYVLYLILKLAHMNLYFFFLLKQTHYWMCASCIHIHTPTCTDFSGYQRQSVACEQGRRVSGTWMTKEKCTLEASANTLLFAYNKQTSTTCRDLPAARAKLLRAQVQINLWGCKLQLHRVIRFKKMCAYCLMIVQMEGKRTKRTEDSYTGGQLELWVSRGNSFGCFSK